MVSYTIINMFGIYMPVRLATIIIGNLVKKITYFNKK